eukprot:TRINITY_DN11895_c0_g1_i1.p1 TRINITY_DN11895_c0_g1~~TRINITY_DN11895_c0_g1_i1.p1  ORF type:complete len:366 (-),score=54.65 TRINITY_DN11895_c0_g1_i1:19-1083(-)
MTTDSHRFTRIDEPSPPFTIQDVRNSISPEYFKPSTSRSISYFVKDVAVVLAIYAFMYFAQDYTNKYFYIAFPIFWFCQGTMFWALFVVGHDCGHGSFSESRPLNYFIGHLAHTPILVPFHSWRISHHKHHLNTGNLDKDESFVAIDQEFYESMELKEIIWRYYLYPFGGYLVYLIGGMAKSYYSHFWPWAETFKNQSHLIVESVSYIFAFLTFVFTIGYFTSLGFIVKYYFMPYLIFTAWIAIVTHSHHTHRDIPWYRNDDWTFLKGAISTVDRDYGLIEPIHHNIGTHIVHHIFMKIPHYHLVAATEQVKPLLGDYYKKSDVSMFQNMWDILNYCRFVPNIGGKVYFYNKDE